MNREQEVQAYETFINAATERPFSLQAGGIDLPMSESLRASVFDAVIEEYKGLLKLEAQRENASLAFKVDEILRKGREEAGKKKDAKIDILQAMTYKYEERIQKDTAAQLIDYIAAADFSAKLEIIFAIGIPTDDVRNSAASVKILCDAFSRNAHDSENAMKSILFKGKGCRFGVSAKDILLGYEL